ncbi:helix-turn-helix transcriptional regulator [Hominicoprocola fusiformis]|jgi:transcriptional regulator with XRE-family HTH domain|nr:helix-turn-helix domain-containing protein [Hominicoprocola fusiformis]
MKLSELIIEYRREHGISQRQMASQCSLSTGYISLIEKEINPQTGKPMVPSLAVLNKLAKGMGITLDNLLSVCDDMPVDISATEKTVLDEKDGLDLEIAEIILSLSESKKQEALRYLRYLAAQEEN